MSNSHWTGSEVHFGRIYVDLSSFAAHIELYCCRAEVRHVCGNTSITYMYIHVRTYVYMYRIHA